MCVRKSKEWMLYSMYTRKRLVHIRAGGVDPEIEPELYFGAVTKNMEYKGNITYVRTTKIVDLRG